MSTKPIFALLFTLIFSVVEAKQSESDELPHFINIGAEDQTGVISMECEGEPPFQIIKCNFNQVYVRRRLEAKALEQKIAAVKTQKFERSQYEKTCKSLNEEEAYLNKKLKEERIPERALAATLELSTMKTSCTCKTDACIRDTVIKDMTDSSRDCLIATNQFTVQFKRVNKFKWVSNEGPKGICNIVNVTTIERDKSSEYLWNFTQVRADADKEGIMCKDLEINNPIKYSSHFGTSFKMECPAISFSPI